MTLLFSGKTKLVDIICTITDKYCNVDTIDDTVTGSFQQIDLNRHLEELSHSIEELLIKQLQSFALTRGEKRRFIELIRTWEHYVELQKKSSGEYKANRYERSENLNKLFFRFF